MINRRHKFPLKLICINLPSRRKSPDLKALEITKPTKHEGKFQTSSKVTFKRRHRPMCTPSHETLFLSDATTIKGPCWKLPLETGHKKKDRRHRFYQMHSMVKVELGGPCGQNDQRNYIVETS